MVKKFLESYHVQQRSNPQKHPKIWGIDPMSTALAFAFVRLYQNFRNPENGQFEFKNINLGGLMVFCVDRRRKVRDLRLFDINEFRLLFKCEVYANMNQHYRILKTCFHSFPIPKMVVGMEFSNEQDSHFFKMLVEQYCPKMDID